MIRKNFGKFFVVVASLLLVTTLITFVSCPNNGISGQVEKDTRNNARIEITGTINEPLTDTRKFTVTLTSATFQAMSRGEDVSAWFVNENGEPYTIEGLRYRIASPVSRGSNKATIRITGTPVVASKEQIHMLIPCDTFQGPVKIDVKTEDSLYYNIADYKAPKLVLIEEDGNDGVVKGMEGKTITTTTVKFEIQNGYFKASTNEQSITTTSGGDGSIINAQTGGAYLDPDTNYALTYKWSAINADDKEARNKISLVISGKADKLRSSQEGDTYTIKLLSAYYGEIIDEKGEAFTEDLVAELPNGNTFKGSYEFTEVMPKLEIVDKKSSDAVIKEDTTISGMADEDMSFSSQSVYLRIYDGKLNIPYSSGYLFQIKPTEPYEITYDVKPTIGGVETEKGTFNVTDFFDSSYAAKGLNIYGAQRYSNYDSTYGSYYYIYELYIGHNKVTASSPGEKLIEYKDKLHNIVIPKNLIVTVDNNGNAKEIYNNELVSEQKVAFNITEKKPYIQENNMNNFVFFTATATDPVAEFPYATADSPTGDSARNGGSFTLYNKSSFRFKSSVATGNEIEIPNPLQGKTKSNSNDTESTSLVTISPMKSSMRYFYKISPNDDGSDVVSIMLYVKPTTELDEDGEVVSPTAKEIGYKKNSDSSYQDTQKREYGSFDSNKDLYQIEVTLDASLFEENKVSADNPNGVWEDFKGSDVVISKDSNIVRYRISKKDVMNIVPTSGIVYYENEDGDIYSVDYINAGSFSYGMVSQNYNYDAKNTTNEFASYTVVFPLVVGALPTSKIGRLNSIVNIGKNNIEERVNGKFNTPLNVNHLKSLENTTGDISTNGNLKGNAVNLYADMYANNNKNAYTSDTRTINSALNRFQLVGRMPKGYHLKENITSDDIKIFNAYKSRTEIDDYIRRKEDIPYQFTPNYAVQPIPLAYSDEELKIINDNLKFMIETETDGAYIKAGNTAEEQKDRTIKPLYLYVDKLTDENGVLSTILFKDDERTPSQFAYPDIAINPSVFLKDGTNIPYVSEVKALKKDADGNYLNSDLWIRLSDSSVNSTDTEGQTKVQKITNLQVYIIPSTYTIKYGRNSSLTFNPLQWQYRIMDRSDYIYPTDLNFPGFSKNYTPNLAHSPRALSMNADLTTGVAKTVGKGLTKDHFKAGSSSSLKEEPVIYDYLGKTNYHDDISLSSFAWLPGIKDPSSRKYVSYAQDTWDFDMRRNVHTVPMDRNGIPIREITNGAFNLNEYTDANRPVIVADTLKDIVSHLKRPGYRVAGFSRGRNNSISQATNDTYIKSYVQLPRNVWSDLIPYKGIDDFGNEVDWRIYYTEDGSIDMTKSAVLRDGIKLQLSDAQGYKNYLEYDMKFSNDYSDIYAFSDYINTTYIYVVWEQDPKSPYYNKVTTANLSDFNSSLNQKPITGYGKEMNFVTIPGKTLNWIGYGKPFVLNQYDYVSDTVKRKSHGYLTDLGDTYTNDKNSADDLSYSNWSRVGLVSANDFAIADIEMTGALYNEVYKWATQTAQDKYDFSTDSSAEFTSHYNIDASTKDTATYSPAYGGQISGKTYSNIDSIPSNQPITHINVLDAMLFCNAMTEWYNATQNPTTPLDIVYRDHEQKGTPIRSYSVLKHQIIDRYISAPGKIMEVDRTGFRLPSYNEWYAAATIVPEANHFMNLATGSIEFDKSSNANYSWIGNSGLAKWLSGGHSGSTGLPIQVYKPFPSDSLYDTVYPFRQNLNSPSGLTESALIQGKDKTDLANYSTTTTIEVGSKYPNALGLYDMSGNLAEWTSQNMAKMEFDDAELSNGWGQLTIMLAGGSYLSNDKDIGLLGNVGVIPSDHFSAKNFSLLKDEGRWSIIPTQYRSDEVKLDIAQRSYDVGFRVCRTVK